MTPLVVDQIARWSRDDDAGISARITAGADVHRVWYRTSGGVVADGADAWLAATLLPAMRTGGALQLHGALSPRLLRATSTIQDIFRVWYPRFRPVPVEGHDEPAAAASRSGEAACFFSAGVDSFYTFLKRRDEVGTLIFIHGFDIRLDQSPLRETVARTVREIARELGRPLVEVETNLRDFSDRYVRWGQEYFGAALASIALLLAPRFGRIYLPASVTYAQLQPWGSHPLVDELWSTEQMELVHDGCEATRVQKIASIARHEIVLRTLRVCWENRGAAYNCGRCEKCLRTMIGLRAAGVLDRCRTFPSTLRLPAVATVWIPNAIVRSFYEQSLDAVRAANADPALAWALRVCLSRPRLALSFLAHGAPMRARWLLGQALGRLRRWLGLTPRRRPLPRAEA